MSKKKTHMFRGVKYVLEVGAMDGMCQSPDLVESGVCPTIFIPQEPNSNKRYLETLIHESLHACHFSQDEKIVTETAADIAALLWKDGWRRKK